MPETAIAPAEAALATTAIVTSDAIKAAIALGKDGVEVLERLHAIAKEERAAAAEKAYVTAMAAFRGDMPHVLKTVEGANKATRKGTRTVGLYAPLDAITAILNPVAARHGFSYRFDRVIQDGKEYVVCIVTHAEGHRETSRFPVKDDTTTGRNAIQAVASGASYAKRYALIDAFGITTADPDDDGESAGERGSGPAVSEEQAATLRALFDGAPDAKAEVRRFCGWKGIKSIDDLPAADYAASVKAIEAKRANGWKSR